MTANTTATAASSISEQGDSMSIPNSMKAMTLRAFGGTEGFELAELSVPKPKAGQVLVKVAATSVNPVDFKIRALGEALPFSPELPSVLGMDFAGTVQALGEGVDGFEVGDEVYGCAGGLASVEGVLQGALAEFIPADAKLIALKPKNLSMAEAAALPLVGITAYEGLSRAGINADSAAGKKVLVHGGSGGVGHVALQLAKHMGAQVSSTGGGDKQLALIKQLGAKPINYKTETVDDYVQSHTNGAGFDAIYDSVGGAHLANSIQAAGLNAHISTTDSFAEVDLSLAHLKGLSLNVVFMLIPMIHNVGREQHGKILAELASIVDAGALKPVLTEQQFSLEQTAAAHDYAEAGTGMGKVVISVAG
ncbi:zinc-dependent alcohol dehydrogenase family protein [Agaribacterium sp. ZY112]|uniref:zinc-dependent alcohol dehydrogenase family protein n=1 Tax=Agaribacterium sp. ZY112 TaxID=3233574 RepID=UPI0035250F58